ncbi:hypothetical protein M407DRAFT_75483 [Tulasnella calospora MUT 4182]|uniref:Uncharacterized protein n=1 Tax=Tulasnella calospora MUT 4182 TaxID=1051891 RepID=A0A0C3LW07_9AGAM|nr:hypothetical protein M407DRAFT_75483 [Tulasnella calospora MUT 4182]
MNTPPPNSLTFQSTIPGGDNFHDVTRLIDVASGAMQTGQLLAMDHFTLMDAMNAIEIMDPRMDNGVTLPNDNESKTASFDPQAPLSPEEISWILDRAIAAEMDWHSGKFMANSIHTLQYVHSLTSLSSSISEIQSEEDLRTRPQELLATVLRPCVIGFLKTCDLIWRQLTRGLIYDGEDFHAEKFEVGLCEGVQIQKVLEGLDTAEQRLNDWTDQLGLPNRDMLLLRVQLRKSLVRAFSSQPDSMSPGQLSQLRSARSILEDITSSPSPSEPAVTSPARAAFDPAICRKLVVVTPLKPIELSSQVEAWTVLRNELDGLIGIHEIAEQGTSADWMIMLKSRSPQWALDLVYRHIVPIQHDYILSLASNLSQHMLIGGAAHDSHHLFSAVMDLQRRLQEVNSRLIQGEMEVYTRLEPKLLDHLLLSLNQNRPRTRRNFAKVLPAWHKVEEDATQLMITIRAPMQHLAVQLTFRLPLVIHHFRLTMITEYVMAGFELELYEKSEWPFLYWYVAVILGEQVRSLRSAL